MSKFVEDLQEDIRLDSESLTENISPEEVEMGECWQTIYDQYMACPTTGDEWYAGKLCGTKNFIKFSLPLLIKDMKEYNDDRPIPLNSEDRLGFQKAIDYIRKLQEELEKGLNY